MKKPNFESINYSIRPGKSVERKMLAELFGRVSILDNIMNYRYIGFGSAYFTDFKLFHKDVGIRKMLSIEKEKDYAKRVNFNKPYSCIEMKYGASEEVLPNLPWKKWKEKSIIWLDYTQKLHEYMLSDLMTLVSEVKAGSIILISVNVAQDKDSREKRDPKTKVWRYNLLKKRIGEGNIPQEAKNLSFSTSDNKKLIRQIIDTKIKHALRIRNGVLQDDDKLLYSQLINIHYNDGASMLTVGGIIFDKKQNSKVEQMNFKNLNFICKDAQCFEIAVPKLTYKEIHALDKCLPNSKSKAKRLPLSIEDIENYSKIYRYFPTFTESNL